MEILLQLGANETAFIQFVLFIITISFLTIVIYGPFYKAYDLRLKLTKGAEQVASETQDEAKKIDQIYQVRAREINEKIKNIFDSSRKQASDSAGIVLTKAKESVAISTDQARAQILLQRQGAEAAAKNISDEVASEITKKLIGAAL